MQAIIIKKWCDDNLTPVAWQRVTMKIFSHLREKGFSLTELENPSPTILLASDTVALVNQTIYEMYDVNMSVEA